MKRYEQEIEQVKTCMKDSVKNLETVPKCIQDLDILIRKVESNKNVDNIDKALIKALEASKNEYTLIEKFSNLAKDNKLIDPAELYKTRSHILFVQQQRQEYWKTYQEVSSKPPEDKNTETEYPGISIYWVIFMIFLVLVAKGLKDGKKDEWIKAFKEGHELKGKDKED